MALIFLRKSRTEVTMNTDRRLPVSSAQRYTILFYLLLAVEVAWILALPLFPTQDGPVHLYFTSITSQIFSGSALYARYFYLQHILPPYSLDSYLLILLFKVAPPSIAEKLLAALIVTLTATGFRYLAGTLGDKNGVVSLAVLPLAFHQSLLMGFYNYSLGLGLALWAAAMWIRASGTRDLKRWLCFIAMCVLVLLAHPVPLLLLLGFTGIELAIRIFRGSPDVSEGFTVRLRRFRADLVFFCMAAVSLGYVAAFINRTKTAVDLNGSRTPYKGLLNLLKASPVAAFAGPGLATGAYRLCLWLMLLICVWIAAKGFLGRTRERKWAPADAMLIPGVLLILLYPVIPSSINGSGYFADRLVVAAWLICLVSAAGTQTSYTGQRVIAGVSLTFTIFVLVLAQQRIAPVARQLSELENLNVAKQGEVGLLFNANDPPSGLAVTPYWWSGVTYFRRANDVLLSAPWLESHYIMLAGKSPLMTVDYPKEILGDPRVLLFTTEGSQEMRKKYLPLTQVILIVGDPSSAEAAAAKLGFEQMAGRRWNVEHHDWFSVYHAGP